MDLFSHVSVKHNNFKIERAHIVKNVKTFYAKTLNVFIKNI
jgi:hypothetical protein